MTPEKTIATNARRSGKPFPWYCPECGKKAVWRTTVPYTTEILHDGKLHTVSIPNLSVPRCEACGEMVFDIEVDQQKQIVMCAVLGLLTSDEIRANRGRLGVTPRELADHLGVAAATVTDWEEGLSIQSRAMDRFLRVYFQSPEGRAAVIEFAAAAPRG
ncbi:MAG TPA: type II TA system antitoxin MqsA family protein [Pirellulales bacterium]|nr:type II TA system antitoxin MqsA family protein [Pirellulales bacterium]